MGKVLRWVGIILMGLTAAFTIMGGAGTTCVALAAENYDSMVEIAPYKWLYVIFVIATIAAGVMMARAVDNACKTQTKCLPGYDCLIGYRNCDRCDPHDCFAQPARLIHASGCRSLHGSAHPDRVPDFQNPSYLGKSRLHAGPQR